MPPAGLLRDNPPEARLRIRRCACICHRQRLAPDLQRKATRGSVLWTPRKGGEPKGGTKVAAYAVRRGWCARVSLPLRGTSDRDFTPPLHAARGNRKQPEQNPVIASQCSHWRGNPYFGPMISAPTGTIQDSHPRKRSGRCGDPAWTLHQSCTIFRRSRCRATELYKGSSRWRPFFLPPGALKD